MIYRKKKKMAKIYIPITLFKLIVVTLIENWNFLNILLLLINN